MSAKKKTATSNSCSKCGCFYLPKDSAAHEELCGKPLDDWNISLIRPNAAMKGYITFVERIEEFLPPDGIGWTKSHAVFVNPSTLESLGAVPRQPVKMSVNDEMIVAVLWPCKELGAMKIGFNSTRIKTNSFAFIELISDVKKVDCLSVKCSVDDLDDSFKDYFQMYLTNSYVMPGVPIHLRFYGQSVEVTAETVLEDSLQDLSLCEGEIVCQPTYFVKTDCLISIEGLKSDGNAQEYRNFDGIGGMKEVKETLMDNIVNPYLKDRKCCSVLMWGLPGSGKSLILKRLSQILNSSALYIESLEDLFDQISFISSNMVLILDLPSVEKDNKGYSALNKVLQQNKASAVVLSIRQVDDLELGLRVRFPIELECGVPIEAERVEILQNLLPEAQIHEISELAKRTHGFTGGDLNSIVVASSFARGETLWDRLLNAKKKVRPTGIREFILEVPDVRWQDIGGNEELKLEIQQAVIWPQQHQDVFERFGIDPPAGILLYGPPGCSKTLVARALANESKMNFLAVKGPELFSKWVGDSEKAIRELFARARQVAPTIIFFDEIDAVGSARGSESSSGVSDRVLAQLLTELDGLEKSSSVILLAATNRPDQLDSALLRPGRLDRSIYVGLPSDSTRRSILQMRTKKMVLSEDVSVEMLVQKTEGYSGAELVALCRHAALVAMREDIKATSVGWKHFAEALLAIVPRTEKSLLDIYQRFQLGCLS